MQMVGSVLFGADDLVAAFVAQRVPRTSLQNMAALGVIRRNQLVAGVVYQNFRDIDIEVVIAADRSDWAFPSTLRTLFADPFVQLGVVRMTAIIGRKNKKSRAFCKALGFREEGICRKAMDGREDAVLYGLLRSECKFLRTRENGQEVNSCASRAA